ncbi:MAG: S8 family serine peptidase [Bacteroidales bacterium]|nr:S8 family serine peptidase [Bacteroidales bacterium]
MLLICSVAALATEKCTVATKRLLAKHPSPAHQAMARHDGLVEAFITIDGADCEPLRAMGVKVHARCGDVLTVQIPLERIPTVAALPMVRQIAVSEPGDQNTDISIPATDAAIVAQGTYYGLPKNYAGKGVVVGVIDAGIDFNHKAFADASGNTRIKRVYMPGSNTGKKVVLGADTLPGSEFFPADVPLLTTDRLNSNHGTHCLGIAAGSKVGAYSGIAPGADIVVCALGFAYVSNQVAVINSARYILNYAKSVGKPCVISISLGFQGGPHDGSSAYCQALTSLAHEGAVICTSAGNLAGENRVLRVPAGAASTVGTTLPCATDSVIGTVTVDTWSRAADAIGVKLLLIDPTTKKVVFSSATISTDKRLTAGPGMEHDTDFSMRLSQYARGTVEVTTSQGLNGHFNLRTAIDLKKLDGAKHYLLAIQLVDQSGVGHTSWLWGSAFTAFTAADGTPFVAGTQDGYINDSATARDVISVGNYVARNAVPIAAGGTHEQPAVVVGDIYPASSFGTDEAGVPQPTIAAPGHMVISALNTYDNAYYEAKPERISFASYNAATATTNYWGQSTGTSMAAPTVAGIVALWLEAHPSLTPAEVKQLIISSAIRDAFVERHPERFGAGKVNALGAFPEAKLPLNTILSSDKYTVGRSFCITDKILRVLRIAPSGNTLYVRSDGESFDTSKLHWMAIDLPQPLSSAEMRRFAGAWLNGVSGVLTDRRNPRMAATVRPVAIEQVSKPKVPSITPAHYHGTQAGHYFAKPKPMEVDTVRYAMYSASQGTISMPPYAQQLGIDWWQGKAKLDCSHYEDGEMPALAHGATYAMVTLTMLAPDGTYVACPLSGVSLMSPPLHMPGDVNDDGNVNVTDVTALINHILGTATYPTHYCDINADGAVNVTDVTALINLILGN